MRPERTINRSVAFMSPSGGAVDCPADSSAAKWSKGMIPEDCGRSAMPRPYAVVALPGAARQRAAPSS